MLVSQCNPCDQIRIGVMLHDAPLIRQHITDIYCCATCWMQHIVLINVISVVTGVVSPTMS